MKIDIFVGGLSATLNARILPLTSVLKKFNVECNIIPPIDWHSFMKCKLGNILSVAFTHHVNRYIDVLSDPSDVVIIGRTSTPQMYLLQKLLKSRNTKVIFDLDDALFLPTGRLFGVNIRPGSFCLEGIIKNADFVTVDNHYLLKYVQSLNQNSVLIHNPIDVDLFVPKSKSRSNEITIGWHGNPRAHYKNLRMLIKPLEKTAHKCDIKFKIVSYLGDLKVKQMFRTLEKVIEVDYGLDHWVPLAKYSQLLSDFDIMVAPLQKTSWYEGKSALRVGLGMAMGIPVVASPVGEQKYIIKHGINGFLAKNEEEWYQYLKILIEDKSLRMEMGKNGRETAENLFSLDACGKKLFNILTKLFKNM